VAGVLIATLCAESIRGIKSPLSVDFTSSMELGSGFELSVLMPTWEKDTSPLNMISSARVCFKVLIIDLF
jgi:hypothetical protein